MAPEQVLGNPLDHCTDIFAFGTVLYEMLSGHYAFRRNSSVETMAAILKEDPAELLSSGEQQVPGALERIVRRCLEKSPGQRFQSAKDLSFALENMSAGTSQTQTLVAPPQNRWRKISLVLVIFAVVAIAFATRGFLARPQQPEFRRITFRKGAVSAARFAPDGESVIYAAAWENPSNMLYRSRLDGTDLRRLDMPANDLLAVSHSGELAIVSKGGTSRLARAPVNGGAPRELLDHVVAADWSPDATQLAIARYQNGKCRLEYPIGRLVYETISTISDMRLSPQGDAIAFMEHPLRGDDRGTVVLTDLKGNRRALTAEWNGEQGLAWSPDGREVWFTATSRADWERDLYAVSRSGKLRRVLRTPATPYLEDIASDGRVLLRRQDRRYEVAAGKIGGQTRLLSWLEIMLAASVSRDGNYVVIGDWSGIGGGDYDVYLAKLDGSPAVLLGSGIAGGISPDNKWVTSILPSDTTKVLLLPTGIGETKTITAPNFHYHGATWASDGHTLVVRASESDRPLRFWVQDTAGGSPRAVTPEGAEGVSVTVNHSDYISVRDAAGTIRLYPIHGGEPKTVPGVTEAEQVIGGSMDSDVVYVSANPSAIPQQILKVNVATGRRQPFVTVSPSDAAGITGLGPPIFSADENRYVYTQVRELSVLYVAAGLK
jgi:Tol biopolymer transport system component